MCVYIYVYLGIITFVGRLFHNLTGAIDTLEMETLFQVATTKYNKLLLINSGLNTVLQLFCFPGVYFYLFTLQSISIENVFFIEREKYKIIDINREEKKTNRVNLSNNLVRLTNQHNEKITLGKIYKHAYIYFWSRVSSYPLKYFCDIC